MESRKCLFLLNIHKHGKMTLSVPVMSMALDWTLHKLQQESDMTFWRANKSNSETWLLNGLIKPSFFLYCKKIKSQTCSHIPSFSPSQVYLKLFPRDAVLLSLWLAIIVIFTTRCILPHVVIMWFLSTSRPPNLTLTCICQHFGCRWPSTHIKPVLQPTQAFYPTEPTATEQHKNTMFFHVNTIEDQIEYKTMHTIHIGNPRMPRDKLFLYYKEEAVQVQYFSNNFCSLILGLSIIMAWIDAFCINY